MKVSVLGCGRWGSCIAWYLDKTGHEVLSCGLPDAPEFITLRDTRKNDYLEFPESIEITAATISIITSKSANCSANTA